MDVRKKKKQPLPDWFLDEPYIPPGDQWLISAFWDLSTCRDFAEMGPISWRDIVYYAGYYGLDEFSSPYFVTCIRALDEAYRDYHHKKPDENKGDDKGKEKRVRRKRQR